MARPLRPLALLLALLAWPPSAQADPAPREGLSRDPAPPQEQPPESEGAPDDDEEERPASPGSGPHFLLALRPAVGNLALADASFSGSGRPLEGGPREQVAFKGREAGYEAPFYLGAEVAAHALIEHVSLGVAFEAGAITESDAPRASPDVTRKVDGSSAYFLGGAFGLGGYLWLGPALVRAEVYAGARHFAMSLQGYEYKTCRNNRGIEEPCPEKVASTQPMLQPRLSLDAVVSRSRGPQGVASLVVGPWVGLELVPARSVSAGLSIGFMTSP